MTTDLPLTGRDAVFSFDKLVEMPGKRDWEKPIWKLIQEHNLRVEKLTQEQLVDLISQMIASGDIVRYVQETGPGQMDYAQKMVYQPFHEVERLTAEVRELKGKLQSIAALINLPC